MSKGLTFATDVHGMQTFSKYLHAQSSMLRRAIAKGIIPQAQLVPGHMEEQSSLADDPAAGYPRPCQTDRMKTLVSSVLHLGYMYPRLSD
jgi:hypothetical protein